MRCVCLADLTVWSPGEPSGNSENHTQIHLDGIPPTPWKKIKLDLLCRGDGEVRHFPGTSEWFSRWATTSLLIQDGVGVQTQRNHRASFSPLNSCRQVRLCSAACLLWEVSTLFNKKKVKEDFYFHDWPSVYSIFYMPTQYWVHLNISFSSIEHQAPKKDRPVKLAVMFEETLLKYWIMIAIKPACQHSILCVNHLSRSKDRDIIIHHQLSQQAYPLKRVWKTQSLSYLTHHWACCDTLPFHSCKHHCISLHLLGFLLPAHLDNHEGLCTPIQAEYPYPVSQQLPKSPGNIVNGATVCHHFAHMVLSLFGQLITSQHVPLCLMLNPASH